MKPVVTLFTQIGKECKYIAQQSAKAKTALEQNANICGLTLPKIHCDVLK